MFAIYRCAKIKTIAALRASASHNSRTRPTPNADKARTPKNEQLLGFEGKIPTPQEFLDEWTRRSCGLKRKKDAVLAQELFLGVSPEYYGDSDPATRSLRLEAWKERAVKWLRETFGEGCFSATLHDDESTPHLACYVLPVAVAKNGERWLSAKRFFNPKTLRQQQDSYARALADIGLERGIRGSSAKHIDIHTFYGALQPCMLDEIEQAAKQTPLIVPPKKLFESDADYQKRVECAVDKHVGAIRSASKKIEALAQSAEVQRRAAKSMEATNKALSRRLEIAEDQLKVVVGKLRDIPLEQVLSRLGFGEPTIEGSTATWDTGDHRIVVNASAWSDQKSGKNGRKAIDLVCHIMACTYVDAVAWLGGQWPAAETAAAIRSAADDQVAATPKKTLRSLWTHYAEPSAEASLKIRKFLTERFSLSPDLVDRTLRDGLVHGSFQKQLHETLRTWCVFNHRHENGKFRGCSLQSAEDGPTVTRCIGDRTTSFFRVGTPFLAADAIALVNDPVAALSYVQLHPCSHAISLARSREIAPAIHELIKSTDRRVIVALDREKSAEDAWVQLLRFLRDGGLDPSAILQRVKRAFPIVRGANAGGGWNDMLKASLGLGQPPPRDDEPATDSTWEPIFPPIDLRQKRPDGPSISRDGQ